MFRKTVTVLVLSFVLAFSAWAQDNGSDNITADEDALFSGAATSEEDSMFSADSGETETGIETGGVLVVDIADSLDSGLEYDALESETVRIGGSFDFNAADSWMWTKKTDGDGWEEPAIDEDRFALDLAANIFFEARPDTDTKFYGSVDIRSPLFTLEDDETTPLIDESRGFEDIVKIDELFADFNWNEDIFFRAGKQTVNYGVGYFYSPADVLSIGEIDPEDPEAELEGPAALKASVPMGVNSLQVYALADEDITTAADIALVPAFEFVLGSTEVGIGGYYRSDKAPRAMATLTTSVFGDESIFAEALVGYGTPEGLTLSDRDEWFAQLTGGLMYSGSVETDAEFNIFSYTLAGQYLYNYGDDEREELITMPGDHYLTLMGAVSDIAETGVSVRATWQANLSDGSSRLYGSVGWELFDGMKISAGLTWLAGEPGDEYTTLIEGVPGNDMVMGTISASFGKGSF